MINWLNKINPKIIIILFFILCSLPVGISTVLLTPISQAPDEPAHVGRAVGLLHGAILPVRKFDFDTLTQKQEALAGVKVDSGIWQAGFGDVTPMDNRTVETEDDLKALEHQRPDHQKQFVAIPNTATYFPIAYIPAAAGFEIGILTKSSPMDCILIGRFFMFAAFFSAGIGALWITRYGEAFLLAILLLPMTLFLSGTINEDGFLIGIMCLGCAALTNATKSNNLKWLGFACLTIFCLSKPPYLPLLSIGLLPFYEPGFLRRARDIIIVSSPVILWVALLGMFVLVPIGKPAYHPGPLYLGNPAVLLDHADDAGNLKILLSHPALLLSLPFETNKKWGIQHCREMIGIIGQLQIRFSDYYYLIWMTAGIIALAGISFSGKLAIASWRHDVVNFIFIGLLLIFTYWLIMISFYLNWTDAGDDIIDGLQGRYSIPLLPFLLFAFPVARAKSAIRQFMFAIPVVILGIYDIGLIPLKIVMSYYLH